MTFTQLEPSAGQAGAQLVDAQSDLNRQQAEALDAANAARTNPYTRLGLSGIEKSLGSMLGARKNLVSPTGPVGSTYRSNNGLHEYRGQTLGMRQLILGAAQQKRFTLPPRFEDFSPSMVEGLFGVLVREGKIKAAGSFRAPTLAPEMSDLDGLTKTYGTNLGRAIFAASRIYDGAHWVPGESYRFAEQELARHGQLADVGEANTVSTNAPVIGPRFPKKRR